MSRTHIVLVPGFVGFDGLGQLAYYAGTTDLFKAWKARATSARAKAAVLHYFDNFPTASVATRAFRLRDFLSKKIARGEIAADDHISLVGHSTGGLDIRRLLVDLAEEGPGATTLVDGPKPVAVRDTVTPGEPPVGVQQDAILSRHREMRIVFLSVPHYGSNIASFIEENRYRQAIRGAITVARIGLESNHGSVSDLVAPFLLRNPLNSNLALAILDALRESDLRAGNEREKAYEREALSDLLLWLGHMESDFAAIDDLRPGSPAGSTSPAHFDQQRRNQEFARCDEYGIRTRSYLTRAPVPATVFSRSQIVGTLSGELAKATVRASFKVALASAARAPEVAHAGAKVLANLVATGPGLIGQALAALPLFPRAVLNVPNNILTALRVGFARDMTDVVFAIAYSMCAYQPFPGRGPFTLPRFDEDAQPETLGPTDNDGVVNTLSMRFKDAQAGNDGNHQAVLVDRCDHADIIGHYDLQESLPPKKAGRHYSSYDFFKSGSEFDLARFRKVWEDVFTFCA